MNIKTYSLDSRVYSIISIISLILLFYSIWEMKPIIVNLDDFVGLTSHLTLAYWIGFIIIILFSMKLYADKPKQDYIYLIYLIVIGLYLFAVPIFAEDNARFPWSYYPAGEVKNVLDINKIDIASKYPLLSYRSWPATHFISVYILYFTDIKIEDMIKYMPLFWIILVILITFSTGKRLGLSINKSFLMSMITISSFWSFHYYYGPQSLVYLLYILSFMIMVGFNKHVKGAILTLLIFTTTVMMHMLTSIALIFSFMSSSKLLVDKNRIKFIVLILIIFFTWYIYIAPTMFNTGVKEAIEQITNAEMFSFAKTGKYEEGTLLTRQITHYARISYLGIYAILMAISMILYVTGRTKEGNRNLVKICVYWLIGIFALFMFKYGAEVDDRIYILSLMPMALILVSSFKDRYLIIITILLISLHIPAHYGSESFDQTLTTDLKGAEFFAKNIPGNTANYSYYYSTYIKFYEPKKTSMVWKSFTAAGRANISKLDTAKYIVDSDGTHNFMMYALGHNPVQEWLNINQDNRNLDAFYDNGHFKTYKK